MARTKRIAQHEAPGPISRGEEFIASSLSATKYEPGNAPHWTSRLDGHEGTQYGNDRAVIDYVVYSYNTPIAWRRSDGTWHVVEQKFSITTSTKHQSRLYLIPNVTTGRGAKVSS